MTSQLNSHIGMDRRDLLKRAAVTAGALVWAAPAVQSIGRPAFAQVGSPVDPEQDCGGFAYDLRLTAAGLVSGSAGPVRESPADVPHPRTCFANVTVGLPDAPDLVTSATFCVENDFTAATCRTEAEWEDLVVDLGPLTLDVGLTASVLKAVATAAVGQPPEAHSHLANASLTVGVTTINLPVAPPPNTIVAVPADPLLSVTLVLNEQYAIADGIAVNAVHLTATLLSALGATLQTADLVLAHAEASATEG